MSNDRDRIQEPSTSYRGGVEGNGERQGEVRMEGARRQYSGNAEERKGEWKRGMENKDRLSGIR